MTGEWDYGGLTKSVQTTGFRRCSRIPFMQLETFTKDRQHGFRASV